MRISTILAAVTSASLALAQGNDGNGDAKPSKFGIILLEGFQLLDVFGPLDTLFFLSMHSPLNVSLISPTSLTPVSSVPRLYPDFMGASVVPTHTLDNAPEDLEVLLVPGGIGVRDTAQVQPIVSYIKNTYPKLKYLLTVCTGAALAAEAGVLDYKNATTNKRSFKWVSEQGPRTNWVHKARWVVDGNIYTSSGVSAGIDMTYGFVTDIWGEEIAEAMAKAQEYVRNKDKNNDPFAVPDAGEHSKMNIQI